MIISALLIQFRYLKKCHESKKNKQALEKCRTKLNTKNQEIILAYESFALSTKELTTAKLRAIRANEVKSKFLTQMSHELRTPLNAIIGFSQLLISDSENPLTELQFENLNEIRTAGHHLLDLVNEVLDLAKIESGKLEVCMQDIALREVLGQSIHLIQPQANSRQISIFDETSDSDYILEADFLRLKQVLTNILSNAVKYNPDSGSVTIKSETLSQHRLRISVIDTGQGLTEDETTNLFTPFERLNNSNNVEGTGIGLVIAKHLVEAMGGKIGVDCIVGRGCCFWLEVKLSPNFKLV